MEEGLKLFQLPYPTGVKTDLENILGSVTSYRQLWEHWSLVETTLQGWMK